MSIPTTTGALIAMACLGLCAGGEWAFDSARADEQTAAQERFFEEKVRPLLVESCQECHGAKKQQAQLRLDSKSAVLKGNETGPAVVPGNVDASRIVQVIRYSDDDIQMPPRGKLTDEQIGVLTEWVRTGAYWPDDGTPVPPGDTPPGPPTRGGHWAFQPVRDPALPVVMNRADVLQPIDRFIIARLEQHGLRLAPRADRRTLLRRVTMDLTGLPATYEEVQAFEKDTSPDAYARVVNRLLDSPRYGERWARHWLDVARYADSKGYVFTEERRFPFSYTYRDYVIRAFNEDLRYDRFILEQLAADQLELGDDKRALAAMGYLTVGRRFLNDQQNIIDDRIDVVTRGLMGLTVTCARCHDHKFDPIPTADYYSLYGVFASSTEPDELPLIAKPEETEAYKAYKQELDKRQAAHDEYVAKASAKLLEDLRVHAGDALQQVVQESGKHKASHYGLSFSKGEPSSRIVRAWSGYLKRRAKTGDPVFGVWAACEQWPADKFEEQSRAFVEKVKAGGEGAAVNRLIREAFVAEPPRSMYEVARLYGKVLADMHRQWQALQAQPIAGGEAPKQLADGAAEELRQVLYGADSPVAFSPEELPRLFDRAMRNEARKLEMKVDAFRAGSPNAPPRAMVLLDKETPVTPRIFIRGNAGRPGEEVPRRFLQFLSGEGAKPFAKGSGRLELAQAIVDPANPLTARVLVNRVWQQHFGEGLVRTASDFGLRGDRPSHPELLDYLARQFMEEGWSIKQLHRMILLSATYQQASDDRPEGRKIDPENRLWWRMPRRRLEFEAMRDSMLAASGRLSLEIGGRPVDLVDEPDAVRRTVYGFVDRSNLPGLYRVFDFPNPDVSSPGRPVTTVPQQALFAMNSPFAIRQAEALAKLPAVQEAPEPRQVVEALYRRILARDPDAEELQLGVAFLSDEGAKTSGPEAEGSPQRDPMPMITQYAQILLLSNEFHFVD